MNIFFHLWYEARPFCCNCIIFLSKKLRKLNSKNKKEEKQSLVGSCSVFLTYSISFLYVFFEWNPLQEQIIFSIVFETSFRNVWRGFEVPSGNFFSSKMIIILTKQQLLSYKFLFPIKFHLNFIFFPLFHYSLEAHAHFAFK